MINGNFNNSIVDDYLDNVIVVNILVIFFDVKLKYFFKEKGFFRRFLFRKYKRLVKYNSESDLFGNYRKLKNN